MDDTRVACAAAAAGAAGAGAVASGRSAAARVGVHLFLFVFSQVEMCLYLERYDQSYSAYLNSSISCRFHARFLFH